ncbi:hypothetical protein FB451DRAFT_1199224 [Mycena latifolia]|nr:hypothetical protein FB451DRAFT_1199224 [Mycena latifolia]
MGKNGRTGRTERKYKPVAKEHRRSLKAWAKGAREDILAPHISGFTDALERGWHAQHDYLSDVCNEYHTLISWRLMDHEEPTLPLPVYNKFAIPAKEVLDEEDMVKKRERIQVLNEARIKSPPKARQAFQQYMHESYETEIAPAVEARFAMECNDMNGQGQLSTQRGLNVPFRARVAREMFAALPEEEQAALKDRATAEAVEAKAVYEKAMKELPSKTPEAHQACIDNLGSFMILILRGIQDYTGLHSVVIFGGPMPRFGGELKMLHPGGMRGSCPPRQYRTPRRAKYSFNKSRSDDSDSGSEDSDSDSESGSGSNEADESEEEKEEKGEEELEEQRKKAQKAKLVQGKEKEKATVAAMGAGKKWKALEAGPSQTKKTRTDDGGVPKLTYEQQRNANIAQNKKVLAAIDKAAPRMCKKALAAAAAPVRRSSCNNTSAGATSGEGSTGKDAVGSAGDEDNVKMQDVMMDETPTPVEGVTPANPSVVVTPPVSGAPVESQGAAPANSSVMVMPPVSGAPVESQGTAPATCTLSVSPMNAAPTNQTAVPPVIIVTPPVSPAPVNAAPATPTATPAVIGTPPVSGAATGLLSVPPVVGAAVNVNPANPTVISTPQGAPPVGREGAAPANPSAMPAVSSAAATILGARPVSSTTAARDTAAKERKGGASTSTAPGALPEKPKKKRMLQGLLEELEAANKEPGSSGEGSSSGGIGTWPPMCPQDAPEWFQFALEAGYKYKNLGRGLPVLSRPKEVTIWIRGGRERREWANVPEHDEHKRGCVWRVVVPLVAKLAAEVAQGCTNTYFWPQQVVQRRKVSSDDLSCLRHPGPNGIFLVVLTLYRWGRGVRAEEEGSTSGNGGLWAEAVADASWMVDSLIELGDSEEAEAARLLGDTEQESDQLRSDGARE